MSFRNITTKERFERWCGERHMRPERRIETSRGVALLADGMMDGKPCSLYAVGRNDQNLKLARIIEWKPDVFTTLKQRLDHTEKMAREFLTEFRPYNEIAHEFRKHA